MDEDGYILKQGSTMTNVAGVLAAGEVSDKHYRQVAIAMEDGVRRLWMPRGG